MRNLLILLLLLPFCCYSQSFFKPIPKSVQILNENQTQISTAMFRPIAVLPSIRLDNTNEGYYDANLITSIGSGISYQWLSLDDDNWKSNISITPIAFLIDSKSEGIGLSYAFFVGLFDNRFQIGLGRGITDGSTFGLLSIGQSLNN